MTRSLRAFRAPVAEPTRRMGGQVPFLPKVSGSFHSVFPPFCVPSL